MKQAIAIFASDIHLCHKAPALRQDEPDWYEAMSRPLTELYKLKKELDVPVLYAGDIFDHWKAPPELINFAIQELPNGYAIPGQHDLPNHSYEDIERSAYWTLEEAGVIKHLEPGTPHKIRIGKATDTKLEIYPFPWNFDITPCETEPNDNIKIALIHCYCWTGKYKYPQAPDENKASSFPLSGYDVAVFGDNHQGFVSKNICNCGGFMRRHKPDLERHPFVGVLFDDLSILQHRLDTASDVYSEDYEEVIDTGSVDLAEFTDGLLELRDSKDLDFAKVLNRYCIKEKTEPGVLSIINEALEKENE